MERADLIAEAQAEAERGMVDTCTVGRPSGTELDDNDNVITTYAGIYSGPCRVQQQQPYAERHDAGQQYNLLLRLEVQLPVRVVNLAVDDLVTIVTSRDPDLPGRKLVIRDLAHKTDASSRRVQVQEVTS